MSGARDCGVCWYRYDPAAGDDVWQIEAGTPFEALPEHWRCPKCDSPKERFLPPREEDGAAERLAAAYRAAAERMKDLPICNPALRVETLGFRELEGGQLGIVITPWFMNLVLVPGPGTVAPLAGTKRWHALPAGSCEFTAASVDGVGVVEACSLFSPMAEFESPELARATAEVALAMLFTKAEPEVRAVPAPAPPPSRRDLFTRVLHR